MKSAAAEKAVAAAASAREKERAKAAATQAVRKGPAGRVPPPHGKVNDSPRPADARAAGGKPGDKRPLGLERRVPAMPEDRQSQLKLLIARGKEQGYLTYAQVNDHLPSEIVDPEQIEDIVNTINDMGIPVYEKAPDTESLLASEPSAPADEEAIEEAAAALAALDAELGRTTDPVRMYMREMGTVELLTREGEIRIAKRIEEGLEAVKIALGSYPGTYDLLLRQYETVKAGQMRLVDVIVGFVDPNAPDEIAQPQNPKMVAPERDDAAGDDDEAEGDEDEEAIDTGPDPEEAAKRFASLAKTYHQYLNAL
ncbi:MAG: RNA polymerase sigma factor region1.1 domain-containing protein, partial [Steroidobacteraceae bacterium]